ncbi:MAG: hypothetical protein ACOCV2_13625 [Persicimonas sp.]
MQSNHTRIVAVAVLALSVSGCLSYSTLHGAEPVPEGESEVTAAPQGLAVQDANGSGGFPSGEVAVRHGVSSNSDVGVKLFSLGAGVDYNHAFVDSPSFSASVNPSFSAAHFADSVDDSEVGALGLLNVLADVYKSDALAVTVGLKPGLAYAYHDPLFGSETLGADTPVPLAGATAGVRIRVSDAFSVMPSVDAISPLAEQPGESVRATGSVGFSYRL